MSQIYTVQASDNLSKIAARFGFRSWRTIWDDENNRDFRDAHPSPHLIRPGERLFIPDRTATKTENVARGKRYVASVQTPRMPREWALTIMDRHSPNHRPISGITVMTQLPDGAEASLQTDAQGTVCVTEPQLTEGDVGIVRILDNVAEPPIDYTELAPTSLLPANTAHFLELPDKRRVIDELALALGMVRRAGWGARRPNYQSMERDWDFTDVVIHDLGNNVRKDPRAVQDYHMDQNAWDDIAYQFLVALDGTVYEGRYLAYKSAANAHKNTHKIGILVMGDFQHQWWDPSDDDPTEVALLAVERVVNALRTRFPLTALGGHRDYTTTECPGDELYKHMGRLRANTQLAPPPPATP